VAAAETLAQAGGAADFNLGNALASSGQFAASLEAYDRVLARFPEHAGAKVNFDYIVKIYAALQVDPDAIVEWSIRDEGPEAEGGIARGTTRAAGTGDETTNSGSIIGLSELESRGRLGVRKVFDDTFVAASPRWLKTLDDVPGAFLAERIKHERKRREKAGIGQPDGVPPW